MSTAKYRSGIMAANCHPLPAPASFVTADPVPRCATKRPRDEDDVNNGDDLARGAAVAADVVGSASAGAGAALADDGTLRRSKRRKTVSWGDEEARVHALRPLML